MHERSARARATVIHLSSRLLATLAVSLLLSSNALAQSGAASPPPAKAPASDPIDGTKWLGTLTSPTGPAQFGLEFRRTPKGQLVALAWVPVMHVFTQPTALVQVHDGDYFLDVLNAHLHIEGSKLVGTGLFEPMPFVLERVEAFPPPPDQTPSPSLPAGPAPRWSRNLGAEAWASPVVRDGVIYLGTADGRFHAADARDGHERWTWSDATPIYGDALVVRDSIYFLNDRAELVKLDRKNGKLAWRVALDAARKAAATIPDDDTYSHRTASPVLANGVLYVGSTDGGMLAIDPATGATRWRFDAKSKICAAVAVDGDRVLFGTMDGSFIALRRSDGTEIWRRKLPAAITSQPVVDRGLAIVGSRDYLLHAFRVSDGTEAWRQHFWVSWVESTPRIVDGTLYVGSSDLRAVRALDAATGSPLWSTDVYGSAWASPLVVRDTVFMGVAGVKPYVIDHRASIVAIDRKNGSLRWRRAESQPAAPGTSGHPGSLALAGDVVIAAGVDGSLIALPVSPK